MNLEVDKRAAWVKSLVKKTGTKGIVIGLSGGKDSAAVAAICVKAGIPVLGVNLPIQSSIEDMRYVEALHRGLLEKYPEADFTVEYMGLGSAFDGLKSATNELFNNLDKGHLTEQDPAVRNLVQANMKARLRMVALYALANKYNYLVAGTDNACEAFVGYFTKWGDGCFDFNLIGDLTVDEVVEAGIEAGAPEMCMKRVPSAGLWEGQTDEGEMGVTYKEIALVLQKRRADLEAHRDSDYEWEYKKPAEVSDAAYAEIMRRHNATRHKRSNPPSYSMYRNPNEESEY